MCVCVVRRGGQEQEEEVTVPNKGGGSKLPDYKYIILMPQNELKLCDASWKGSVGGGDSALRGGLLWEINNELETRGETE